MAKAIKLEDMKDSRGIYRTRTLFAELNDSKNKESYEPLYTMKSEDFGTYISARKIYVSCDSEYEAAIKLVGTIEHWNKLLKVNDFVNGVEGKGFEGLAEWRKERIARSKSKSNSILIALANDGNVSAAKAIQINAEKEYEEYFGLKNKTGKTDEEKEIETEDELAALRLLKSLGK